MGPWTTIGERSLTDPNYRPDFTAITSGQVRLLQIDRERFEEAAAHVRSAREAPSVRATQRKMRRTTSGAKAALDKQVRSHARSDWVSTTAAAPAACNPSVIVL